MRARNKLTFGVGINDADYIVATKINGKNTTCEHYARWRNMLMRCYSPNAYPTYAGCSVDHRWHSFMSFRDWVFSQDWEGKSLDKDLLFEGNKVYGPDTCIFVHSQVNVFLTESNKSRGIYPIGVSLHKCGKFETTISIDNKRTYLGLSDTPQEAHGLWYKRKREMAIELAAKQTDSRVAAALIARFP